MKPPAVAPSFWPPVIILTPGQMVVVFAILTVSALGQITSGTMVLGSPWVIFGPLGFGWLVGATGVGTAFLVFAFVVPAWALGTAAPAAGNGMTGAV